MAARAEGSGSVRGLDPLSADADLLRVTIRGPLRTLASDRSVAPEDQPVTLGYIEMDGRRMDRTVGRASGVSR